MKFDYNVLMFRSLNDVSKYFAKVDVVRSKFGFPSFIGFNFRTHLFDCYERALFLIFVFSLEVFAF